MLAGLRLGELRAFRVLEVDLAAGVIDAERGYDPVEGEIALKAGAGRRRVPIAAILRDFLVECLARTGRAGSERMFGSTGRSPFDPKKLQARADRAWEAANELQQEAAQREGREPQPLDRITPHECRHSFASLMIAAGVGAKHLQTYLGHSSVATTLDIYGHLMPGSEEEAAGLLGR